MRAILIGHRGFIGSAIAGSAPPEVELRRVDHENYAAQRGANADVLINAAGDPRKSEADRDLVRNFQTNVMDVLAVLVEFSADLHVHLSTVSVYNDPADRDRTNEAIPIDPLTLSTYGFHKYMAETMVRRLARRSLVLRLGHVVGPGLRRNPIFDLIVRQQLYIHPASRMPFIDSRDLGPIVWRLIEDGATGIYNVAGEGTVVLSELADELGIRLPGTAWELPRGDIDVDVRRLERHARPPRSIETVRRFCAELQSSIR